MRTSPCLICLHNVTIDIYLIIIRINDGLLFTLLSMQKQENRIFMIRGFAEPNESLEEL